MALTAMSLVPLSREQLAGPPGRCWWRPAATGRWPATRARWTRPPWLAGSLAGLGSETDWIASTWGGPGGLAASGTGWGAFCARRLVAVSCPFYVGAAYEDLGVATEPGFRGLGLSTACAAAVCRDVRRRGRVPSWTTSPDNTASLRVAAKLGFRLERHDRLLVADVPVPEPAGPPPQP